MVPDLDRLRDDIGESKDLATLQPTKAAELRAKLEKWRTSLGAQLPPPNPNYDEKRRWEYYRWNPNVQQTKKY